MKKFEHNTCPKCDGDLENDPREHGAMIFGVQEVITLLYECFECGHKELWEYTKSVQIPVNPGPTPTERAFARYSQHVRTEFNNMDTEQGMPFWYMKHWKEWSDRLDATDPNISVANENLYWYSDLHYRFKNL